MDDDRGARVLRYGGSRETHARLKPVGIVNVGFVNALESVVDGTSPFPGRLEGSASLGQRHEPKLADFGGGDEVKPDYLDRRVESVCIFALVDTVEPGHEILDRRIDHRAIGQRRLDGMLLVLVAALEKRRQRDPV